VRKVLRLGLVLADLSLCWMAQMNEREKLKRASFLAEADERIADAEVRIASVQAHIAELELGGRDVSAALKVLAALEGTLELMRRQRDEIARLLDIDRPKDF
jgi:hypothetical protein